jgi:tetraacyldisaccharide 4'-kinase
MNQEVIAGQKGFGFCGIAHPASFHTTASEHGLKLAGFHAFADHQRYSDSVIKRLVKEAQLADADYLLTTEKDLVKLSPLAEGMPIPLYGVRMQVESDSRLADSVLQSIRSQAASGVNAIF